MYSTHCHIHHYDVLKSLSHTLPRDLSLQLENDLKKCPEGKTLKDKNGMTLLHHAALARAGNCIKFLADKKQINLQDQNGCTASHLYLYSLISGRFPQKTNLEGLRSLVKQSPDLKIKDKAGYSCLDLILMLQYTKKFDPAGTQVHPLTFIAAVIALNTVAVYRNKKVDAHADKKMRMEINKKLPQSLTIPGKKGNLTLHPRKHSYMGFWKFPDYARKRLAVIQVAETALKPYN